MTYAYRMLPDGTGYVDETGVHRGAPPTQEDIKRVSLYMMHRMMFGPYRENAVKPRHLWLGI